MSPELRGRFDRLLEEVLDELPPEIQHLLEEVPVVVEDQPDRRTMEHMRVDDPAGLCGLYTGVPLTGRSVEHSGTMPETIDIFRLGIIEAARGRRGKLLDARLKRQIRITLLHEIGHHFGMTEQDLRKLGYQ